MDTNLQQTPTNGPLNYKKRVLRLSAGRPERHLMEVAQQICCHNDHSRLSEAEALEWLKKPVVLHGCCSALAHEPIEIVEP